MSYLLLSKYPPLCIRTIYGCIISSQNYKLQITKLQITLRSWGVCLPAAKEQKFIIILFIIKLSFFTYSAPYEKSDGP